MKEEKKMETLIDIFFQEYTHFFQGKLNMIQLCNLKTIRIFDIDLLIKRTYT